MKLNEAYDTVIDFVMSQIDPDNTDQVPPVYTPVLEAIGALAVDRMDRDRADLERSFETRISPSVIRKLQ